jgi:hypothetical protein
MMSKEGGVDDKAWEVCYKGGRGLLKVSELECQDD